MTEANRRTAIRCRTARCWRQSQATGGRQRARSRHYSKWPTTMSAADRPQTGTDLCYNEPKDQIPLWSWFSITKSAFGPPRAGMIASCDVLRTTTPGGRGGWGRPRERRTGERPGIGHTPAARPPLCPRGGAHPG